MADETGNVVHRSDGVLGADTPARPASLKARLTRYWHGDVVMQALIVLIGAHSCILGLLMLFATEFMLRLIGFPLMGSLFFPSQVGIFLLLMGIFYFISLPEPTFIKTILISKAFAVVFLLAECASSPVSFWLWGALAGDALMLLLTCAALLRHKRLFIFTVFEGDA